MADVPPPPPASGGDQLSPVSYGPSATGLTVPTHVNVAMILGFVQGGLEGLGGLGLLILSSAGATNTSIRLGVGTGVGIALALAFLLVGALTVACSILVHQRSSAARWVLVGVEGVIIFLGLIRGLTGLVSMAIAAYIIWALAFASESKRWFEPLG